MELSKSKASRRKVPPERPDAAPDTDLEGRRGYHQHCGLARALDVLGERWTLLIVRDLLLGPRRYTDLLEELPGLTTNLLARRLSDLRRAGVVEQHAPKKGSPAALYALTPAGAALEPAIMELARWGGRFMASGPGPGDRVDVGWALLSLKRRYLPRPGDPVVVGLEADGREFELELGPLRLEVRERTARRPDVALSGGLAGFQGLLYRQVPPEQLAEAGLLRVVHGDVHRFLERLAPPQAAHQPLPGQVGDPSA